MSNMPASKKIIPVDIRKIRQTLGFSMVQMGAHIALYSQGVPNKPIPGTRVSEWEFRCRAIPDYVFTASTNILLDHWSVDRHMTPESRQSEVDVYYSNVLNQPLGQLFKLEVELMRSGNALPSNVAKQVRTTRMAQQRYLETLLNVRMSYVFGSEMGPD